MEFTDARKSLVFEEIKILQEKLEIKFPNQYVEHLLKFNGGKPKDSIFSFWEGGEYTDSCIDYFFAIHGDGYDDFFECFYDFKIDEKRMPESIFPIAADPGGNLICLDSKNGKVYFWNHEDEINYNQEADTNLSNLYLVANSLNEFIAGLH
jgi:cell wall assembly regulator SMI1